MEIAHTNLLEEIKDRELHKARLLREQPKLQILSGGASKDLTVIADDGGTSKSLRVEELEGVVDGGGVLDCENGAGTDVHLGKVVSSNDRDFSEMRVEEIDEGGLRDDIDDFALSHDWNTVNTRGKDGSNLSERSIVRNRGERVATSQVWSGDSSSRATEHLHTNADDVLEGVTSLLFFGEDSK